MAALFQILALYNHFVYIVSMEAQKAFLHLRKSSRSKAPADIRKFVELYMGSEVRMAEFCRQCQIVHRTARRWYDRLTVFEAKADALELLKAQSEAPAPVAQTKIPAPNIIPAADASSQRLITATEYVTMLEEGMLNANSEGRVRDFKLFSDPHSIFCNAAGRAAYCAANYAGAHDIKHTKKTESFFLFVVACTRNNVSYIWQCVSYTRSALVGHPKVVEAAVVGVPDEVKGQSITAFVTVAAGVNPRNGLTLDLKNTVCKNIGTIACPDSIRFTDALPKTRSGKIMRRLLRDVANGTEIQGDTSTLEDFSTLAKLQEEDG